MTPTQSRPAETELLTFLRSHYLFAGFQEKILRNLLINMEWVRLSQGDYLFHQGEQGGVLYLVFDGVLQVVITGKDGSDVVVAELGRGKPLGEIQFLCGGTRTASVCAKQDSTLLAFSKATFDSLADTHPEMLQQLADIIRQRLRRDQLITILPNLCGSLHTALLQRIEEEIEWFWLPHGQALFHQGDEGQEFFLLISGRLYATVTGEDGVERVVGEVRRGEFVGELAMFTGDRRNASIYAARGSELVKFSREAFERIITAHPEIMMHITKFLIRRVQQRESTSPSVTDVLNIALVPTRADVPLTEFAERLTQSLSRYGKTLRLNSALMDELLNISGAAQTPEDAPNNLRISAWLDEQEAKYRVIVYETDPFSSPWTQRCIQQADKIVIVGQAGRDNRLGEIEQNLLGKKRILTRVKQYLVLLHTDESRLPSDTREWLARRNVEHHYHVRWTQTEDFLRLARIMTGRAVGLVLGGGGARGLAHIGILLALREAGIPIDLIGGTSIGGAISAQYAMGLNYEQMVRLNRKIWIDSRPFNDYTLPVMSLLRGRKFEKIAQEVYGGIAIEDLWKNYFCVSSNLTTTELAIHRYGSLTKALRATASLPGIAVPLIDNGHLLVDGGVLNNLPGDVMREIHGGTVIAVNVSSEKHLTVDYQSFPSPWKFLWTRFMPFQQPIHVPNIFDLLMRTTMVSSVQRAHAIRQEADFYLQPPVERFKLLDFKALDDIVAVGYTYARQEVKSWQLPL